MGLTLTETTLTKTQRHTRDDKSSSSSIITEQKNELGIFNAIHGLCEEFQEFIGVF